LSFLRRQRCELTRKFEVAAVHPPDVVAANQFEFERLDRCIAANLKRELIVRRREVETDLAARDRVPAVSVKIEVEAIDLALAREMHLHAVRGMGSPERSREHGGENHPLTLPAISPAM